MKTRFSLVGLVIGIVLLFAVEGRATTRTVTSLGDGGAGTLRDAIQASDNGDTINFSVTGVISLTSGSLTITKNITISGPGASSLEVSRTSGVFRILVISAGTGQPVSISGIAITNGHTSDAEINGGAILNFESTLTLTDCTFDGNTADETGGAIANNQAILTVNHCVFSNNTVTAAIGGDTSFNAYGGAIYNNGILTVSDSTFTNNFAGSQIFTTDPDLQPAYGGAIYTQQTATVTGCTFSNNTVYSFQEARGGAICNNAFGATSLIVRNCNMTGNSALSQTLATGGGISNANLKSDSSLSTIVTISNCTLSNNSVSNGVSNGGGVYNYNGQLIMRNDTLSANSAATGGGIYEEGSGNGFTATADVIHCTLSNNSGSNGGGIYNTGTNAGNAFVNVVDTILFSTNSTPGANLVNTGSGTSITSQGYNLSSDSGGGFLTATGDQINTDPKLGPLQNNYGPAPTMALLNGSPAWDKGTSFSVSTDARGLPRPYDDLGLANASGGDGSDIGAVEMQSAPSFVVTTTDDHNDGVCDGDCTLREAINAANAKSGADLITFKSGVKGTITLQSGLGTLNVTDSVTITGPGARTLAVSGNNVIRIFTFFSFGTNSISGLNIINGRMVGAANTDASGGGVFNAINKTLTFSDCEFSGNFAEGGDSTVVNGTGGSGFGGAIENAGILTLDRCTFSNNAVRGGVGGPGSTAVDGLPRGGDGGGGEGIIFNENSGTVTINNCTFSGNSSLGGKGGVSQNFIGGAGGDGVAGVFNEGTMTVTGSTFSGNSGVGGVGGSGSGPAFTGASGAGIGGLVGDGTTTVKSTIIAGNFGSGSASSTRDVSGAFTSGGYNLIGTTGQSTGFGATGDQSGTDVARLNAVLGSLQNNGGKTDTFALLTNSPAINASNVSIAPARDQRNYVRAGTPDIGAFEFNGKIPDTVANISTRAFVETGNNVMIGGFVITGTGAKKVIIRARGPSLPGSIANRLQDPTLELHSGANTIATNDNWGNAANQSDISSSGFAPSNSNESAILMTLNPGAYTAIVSGAGGGTGVGIIEGFDLDHTTGSKFGDISTRAFVQTGDNVMIAGFVVTGPDSDSVIVRAIGPSLSNFGVANAMADPTLELQDANGNVLATNDNWEDTQQAQIQATGFAPSNSFESAIYVQTLAPGNYTATVQGKNNTTGVATVEVYGLN